MRITRISNTFLIVLFLGVSIGLTQKGWFGRLFPEKEPQVLREGASSAPTVTPPPEVMNLQDSFARVADVIKPTVVNISAVHFTKAQAGDNSEEFYFGDPNEFFRRFFGENPQHGAPKKQQRTEGTGSGVLIDPEGYILTNNHVVQDANQLTVTLSDGKTYNGKVIGTDERTDLAVIRIKGDNAFPYAALGDSAKLRIGDWVLAIGSPFGLEQTVTAGIVSAIRQSLNIEGKGFRDLIQTDAAINRGNSGGPLVNLRGEVIGINVAIFAPTGVFSGIGFAIPVNRIKTVMRDLIEKGYVERSWMGVEIGEVNEILMEQFGLDSKEGALVNSVVPDSPASKAGLQRGDVIIEFDGKKIKGVGELQDIVSRTPPRRTVDMVIIREGNKKTVQLTTQIMPKQVARGEAEEEKEGEKPQVGSTQWLDAKFTNLNDYVRQEYSIPAVVSGVVAQEIPADSAAAEAGLMEGDVLGAVNRKKITDVKKLDELKKGFSLKEGIVLDVYRKDRWIYLTYKSLQ